MSKNTKPAAAPKSLEERTQASGYPVKYDVRIYDLKASGTQRATANVNINGTFAMRGFRVMEGTNGLFVSMPSVKVKDGYKDICFPCTKEARVEFDKAVIDAYRQELSQLQKTGEQQAPPSQSPQQEQRHPAMSGM
jgi:stage V sporulation protein G